MEYPKRQDLRETPETSPSNEADARTRLGLMHRDIATAQRGFTDAVLELYDEAPEKLEEARKYWDIPSGPIHDVLRRFRRLR